MAVDVINRHGRLRVDRRAIARHIGAMLDALKRPGAVVDVSLVGDPEIRELNLRYRGVDAVTDVLSFALADDDGPPGPQDLLGDIVISLDTARRQADEIAAALAEAHGAAAKAYRMRQETLLLATHGLLHLLGYDHQSQDEAERMESLERRFMASVTDLPVHDFDRSDHGLSVP